MRIVVSIEAAALPDDLPEDDRRLRAAGTSLADLVRAGHEMVVVHSGSQEVQALTRSRLVLALYNTLPGRAVVEMVTHTELGAHDRELHGPDASPVVPVARPHAVVEAAVIRELMAEGTVVFCGGGIPVVRERGTGRLRTVAAVADPALTAALLAVGLDADALLYLSTATHVFVPRDHRHACRPLLRLTPEDVPAAELLPDVRPTVEAAAEFVSHTGGLAAIGPLDNALGTLLGATGTVIRTAPAPSLT